MSSNDADLVVLVDAEDTALGTAGKLDAHLHGLKHRAISVLVRDNAGRFLLQRRASGKYHSGGLWTNACCSHPLPGEDVTAAARRRLEQEMGFACTPTPLFVVQYRADVPGNTHGALIENELVHVFGCTHQGPIAPDPTEVSGWRWMTLGELEADIAARPQLYTVWFRKYLTAHRDAIAAWLRDG